MKSEQTHPTLRDFLPSTLLTASPVKRTALGSSLFLILAGLWLTGPSAHASLLLRYSFDENGTTNAPAVDSGIPPESDGTYVGSASLATNNSPFAGGNALDLSSGNAGYVDAGNPVKLSGLSKFTITFWMNLQGDPNVNDRMISKITASPSSGFELLIYNNSDASTTTASDFNPALQVNGLFSRTLLWSAAGHGIGADHRWIFLAISYDGTTGSQNVKWYEGDTSNVVSLLGTAGFGAGAVNDTSDHLEIGATPATAADRTPPALFDDVRIYNSVLDITNLAVIQQGGGTNSAGGSGPPVISTQPQSQTLLSGNDATFFAVVTGQTPIDYQWMVNGEAIPGATNAVYTLPNVVPDFNGAQFSLVASNSVGMTNTQPASVTVRTLFDSLLTTNLWTLSSGDRSYVSGGNLQRSMAYDPASDDLIVASRNLGNFIVAIDAQTDAEKAYLDTSSMSGGTFALDMVGAGDDGAVYAGNLTTSAGSTPYTLYRWADDSGSSPMTVAFSGDPGGTNYPGQRWGDNMVVRGSGPNTQILLAPVFSGDNIVSLLQTTDGVNFYATPILLTNVPAGFAQAGLAFGPGTNTFCGTKGGGALYLVQFDLATQTGFAKRVYPSSVVPTSVSVIGTSSDGQLLAGLDTFTSPHRVPLYSIADPNQDALIEDQKDNGGVNGNSTFGGLGAIAFGHGNLYVLDSNNSIEAFQINTNYASVAPFTLSESNVTPGTSPVLSWPSEPGHMYQAQSKDVLTDSTWSDVGVPTLANGSSLSVTNILLPGVGTGNRFYRVRGF